MLKDGKIETKIFTKSEPVYVGPKGSHKNFKEGRKCELCTQMKDNVQYVNSVHFRTKHAVRGHLVHRLRDKRFNDRWFIYLINDDHFKKQYIGSTTDMYGRWSSHKSSCNNGPTNTGLLPWGHR